MWAATIAAALAGSAHVAASPFQVDSTGTAESVELKSSFEYRDAPSGQTLIAPKFAIAMPLGDDLEFEVGASYRNVTREAHRTAGIGDTTLEVKWRLARESEHRAAFAVIPELSLPTGSQRDGLGSGHASMIIPLVAEKHIGAYQLSGQLGYARSFGGDEESFPFGVLVTVKPLERLKVGVELAGDAPSPHPSRYELNGNVGFKWEATPRMEIHGLLGRTVRSPDSGATTRFKLVVEMHL
jgi:hypothetical protein